MTSNSIYPVVTGSLMSTQNYTWNTVDTLGKGASAVVYLGRHKENGKYVAVKVFHEHVYMGYKKDNLRELDLLRQLKHENVISLLAVEKMTSSLNIVLVVEYCEGGSLHHMLDQPLYYHGLTEEEFLLVFFHVCSGMEYLQQKNVIHRDIKPGNIMRSITDDGLSIYKLTDFGAARNLYEDENFQSLHGTEEYLHPGMYERAVLKLPNSQTFDAKVDLWSLGVTFYHAATGQLPFQAYGGRSNRRTMFEIITQKECGVISGIQSSENGPIHWKRDLPESSPLSNGLKSIVIPLMAGLMEPNASKMINYQTLFRKAQNMRQQIVIQIFYFNKCEELVIYAEPNTTLIGLQDLIALRTDIAASDQILIIGGKSIEEVFDPLSFLESYPSHLRINSIFLFQREITEVHTIRDPEISPVPKSSQVDMDADARHAHSCSAWGEFIKRNQEKVSNHQEKLIIGLFFLRLYVEGRLETTKVSHEYVRQLLTECKGHIDTVFDMVEVLRDIAAVKKPGHQDVAKLNKLLDNEIKRAHYTASQRMTEIDRYREQLIKKIEDIKAYASSFSATCAEEKCWKKIAHHLSIISGVYTRFRRDRSVAHQMAPHDIDIHKFEGVKLHGSCVTLKSIFTDHCLPQFGKVYKNSIHVSELLTKSLTRVIKIEKNLAIVQKCMNMIIVKLQELKEYGINFGSSADSQVQANRLQGAEPGASLAAGAASSEMTLLSSRSSAVRGAEAKPEGGTSMLNEVDRLKEQLELVNGILDENSRMILKKITPTNMEKKKHKSGSLKRKEQQETESQESSKRYRSNTDLIIPQPISTSMYSSSTNNQEARINTHGDDTMACELQEQERAILNEESNTIDSFTCQSRPSTSSDSFTCQSSDFNIPLSVLPVAAKSEHIASTSYRESDISSDIHD